MLYIYHAQQGVVDAFQEEDIEYAVNALRYRTLGHWYASNDYTSKAPVWLSRFPCGSLPDEDAVHEVTLKDALLMDPALAAPAEECDTFVRAFRLFLRQTGRV